MRSTLLLSPFYRWINELGLSIDPSLVVRKGWFSFLFSLKLLPVNPPSTFHHWMWGRRNAQIWLQMFSHYMNSPPLQELYIYTDYIETPSLIMCTGTHTHTLASDALISAYDIYCCLYTLHIPGFRSQLFFKPPRYMSYKHAEKNLNLN